MILWLLLFLLIVAISFILAFQSMKDFQEIPEVSDKYSLYLIKQKLTGQLLADLTLSLKGYVFSLERLFKGQKEALVIFGPKEILDGLSENLGLLELEDYTQDLRDADVVILELEVKGDKGISSFVPKLGEMEQFWLQTVYATNESWLDNLATLYGQTVAVFKGQKIAASELQRRRVESLQQSSQLEKEQLKYQIRAVIVSPEITRRNQLVEEFESLSKNSLLKIPRPYKSAQALSFYKNRVFNAPKANYTITLPQILNILTT